ncbi:hypothetical protein CY34DRAFT_806212 [Suillus luteus UH-Slu-Lm8-n1]|uniref:Uncharacterized protein n=1 Tax=Suillus luteus UH-Slu-Lm8-n1 TaxID=930992 RepID=A0A0D0BD66_9AGAM|nr:hypothetical protein CY34DRAFT_806212 [Suillus luteus UH-Slu-Lm8-n1]
MTSRRPLLPIYLTLGSCLITWYVFSNLVCCMSVLAARNYVPFHLSQLPERNT